MKNIIVICLLSVLLVPFFIGCVKTQPEISGYQVGYTELRTNLPGGRHANTSTMRAAIIGIDGKGRRLILEELASAPNSSTQFVGWSPDGKTAIIGRGWKSIENAAWEEEHKAFRHIEGGETYDSYLVDVENNTAFNVTAVEQVSFSNTGVFYWPNDPSKLGFTAIIDGNSHPFKMDIDGRNKTDLTEGSTDFTYGFNTSSDGKRIAYHRNYQVYLADADGTNALHIDTGEPFNFGPVWSPNGKWVLFLAGEKNIKCNPYIVKFDGTGLKKLADRGGYKGAIEFLDVYDFHEGSSDTPVWSYDGKLIYYTSKAGKTIELFQVDLNGETKQLTHSVEGTLHYHPNPSPNGKWLLYGSKRKGVRQLFVMDLKNNVEYQITNMKPGYAAMWPCWRPGKK